MTADHYDIGEVSLEVTCPTCSAWPGRACISGTVHPSRYVEAAAEIQRRREQTRRDLAALDAQADGRIEAPDRPLWKVWR